MNTTTRNRVIVFLAALTVWSIFCRGELHAQFRFNIHEVADQAFPETKTVTIPPKANQRRQPAGFNVNQNIDAWLFQLHRTESGTRSHLQKQLALAIDQIGRNVELGEEQKQKLELAGSGDVAKFFDQVEEIRAEFSDDKLNMNNGNDINKVFQRIQPLQQQLQVSLFGDGSIFASVSKGILDESQQSKLNEAEMERVRFHFDASLKNAIAKVERTSPLRKSQRERILELALAAEPPLKSGRRLSSFALYRLAKMKPQLEDILEKSQLAAMEPLLAQGARLEGMLRREGYLK